MKPIARYLEEAGMSVGQLVAAAGLDRKLVEAIVKGNYTPSPLQRQRLAALAEAKEADRRQLVEDLYWSILSSKEFLFNH